MAFEDLDRPIVRPKKCSDTLEKEPVAAEGNFEGCSDSVRSVIVIHAEDSQKKNAYGCLYCSLNDLQLRDIGRDFVDWIFYSR